ncbi:PIN domain-containing protein [Chryseobacterium sp. BIGb0232]|uniref:PIN domain-containing protein n=1 Tax=Chryseobacterium sp. BIGb0232 TaxID=2940598 RepID=UPI000F471999|nr:PIN domain-containing protein [Chryseobacterium sp. BIGb0232]MCS4300620.1 putative nucleic acid-binding protein [Chryseobacterium sp. BIGb0232]ROS20494.1 putative nucleic acid-binding protein [Chryseobacterium nakagawai]
MDIGNIAIDTNVLLYAFDNKDIKKQDKAVEMLLMTPFVTQLVLFEFIKILERKEKKDKKEITQLTIKILNDCTILLSEDMCNGMIVDKKLKIINSFL